MHTVTIVVSGQASGVEKYAAEELQKYLSNLYQIDAARQQQSLARLDGPTIVVGRPADHPCLADTQWPALKRYGASV